MSTFSAGGPVMKGCKSVIFIGLFLSLLTVAIVGCTEEMQDELGGIIRDELGELEKEIMEGVSEKKDELIEGAKSSIEKGKDDLIGIITPGSKEEKAIRWAINQKGNENTYLDDNGRGLCHLFVLDAFKHGAGINVDAYRNLGGAYGVYKTYGANKSEPPKPGTMVLYRGIGTKNTGVSHTALALENGEIIHNNNYEQGKSIIKIEEYDDLVYRYGSQFKYEYLGWIDVVND